ncbi:protein takeout isoform X2 [Halyomorpha halys]|uniref:protein takeout isoform X2 n=1 Tax=Halyomorpha halys TaxID=286706 RepID=UPI0034D23E7E
MQQAKYYFDICHTSDPKYNDCVRKTLEKLKPHLIKGIPELNVQPVEPLHIPKIELAEGNGNFQMKQKLIDLYIHGTSNYTLEDLSLNYDRREMNFTMTFPLLEFESDYELDGQILVLPIKGQGRANYTFTDVKITAATKIETFKKKNKTYVRIKSYSLKIEPTNVRLHFSNLFNGDKILGESTNKFLNDNWREAYNTYRDLPENAFAQYLKALTNSVFEKFPAEEIFPK